MRWALAGLLVAGMAMADGPAAGGPMSGPAQDASASAAPNTPQQCVCPIDDLGGTLMADGQFISSISIMAGHWFELVQASTPTAPSSGTGHARVWLNKQGTTKSALKVIFDDGTVVSIAGN